MLNFRVKRRLVALYCDVKDSNTGKIEDLKELGFRDIEEDLEDEDNESE